MNTYTVWKDPSLNDLLAIQSHKMSEKMKSQLIAEGIALVEIKASNKKQATRAFLKIQK